MLEANMPESDKTPEKIKSKPSKEEKLAMEKTKLEEAIKSNSISSVRERVAYILNNFPSARNSDKTLALVYWKFFQNEDFSPVLAEKLFKLEHVPTLTRERAQIQNSFKLFQSGDKIRKKRAELQMENQENYAAINESGLRISVYADETGKSDASLSVGGVWFLDPAGYFEAWTSLNKWKRENKIKSEFKFSGLTRKDCPVAMAYVKEFLKFKSFTSFKIAWLSASELRRPKEQAVYDLYRYFLIEGAKFEVERKRILTPRQIELVKDKDDGSDMINLKDMEIKLRENMKSVFNGGVTLGDVSSANSNMHPVLQAVDLIIGSFGRMLNKGEPTFNHKDEFAVEVLQIIGVCKKLCVNGPITSLT